MTLLDEILSDEIHYRGRERKDNEPLLLFTNKDNCTRIFLESAKDDYHNSFYARMYIAQNGLNKYVFTVNNIKIYVL